ncbi:hypothetical protein RYZ26_12255 [Terasakiella sp. A23]|uniref:hypothetical protein n=1 Tax=Terasakiella sp. FCG-A23 TaxID=3080561 RepID=UPI0029542B69|nr:hypothetical protein [Terasakiella sp. A23]MDV7340368.1 hypothetical protein [Terasakiella sp. A23]
MAQFIVIDEGTFPMRMRLAVFTFILCLIFTTQAFAEEKSVYLEDTDQKRLKIATLTLTGNTYTLAFIDAPFGDYFLSMRPFRCIENVGMVCHQPYPYDLKRTLSDTDLRPLEYDLLFIARKPGEYGIDPYNGRYFKLSKTDNGFDGIIHAVDLNILASPPDDRVIYPIDDDVLDELEAESAQYPKLIIE